jgi:hypothetical protein
MEKQTLYKIQNNYSHLMAVIEEAEGEITPEIENQLAINEKELQEKSIAYLEIIKQKERFVADIDAEIKRLQALKKQNSNLVSFLKDRLLNAVNLFGDFTVGTLTFGKRKSTKLKITDEQRIDTKFTKRELVITPDKMKIKEAIKSGETVQGAELEENYSLKIK